MSTIRYSDWEVTQKHAEVIRRHCPVETRHMQVRKVIPGVTTDRIIKGLKSGIWIKPLGSVPGMTFSCVQDMGRRSLVVFAEGTTTGQSSGTPRYDAVRNKVIGLFHNRRATGLNGEKYSLCTVRRYDIDDVLRRELDVDVYEIMTWIREDRENDWLP